MRYSKTVSGGMDSQYARRLPADLAATTSSPSAPRTGSTKFKVAHPLRSDRLRFTVERSPIVSSGAVTEVELHDTFRLLQDPLSPLTAP